MPMLRLRRVGSKHEVTRGSEYVGDIDDDHRRDYVSSNLGVKLSVETIRGGGVRLSLARQVAAIKDLLMERDPKLSPSKAFLMAKDRVFKDNPSLAEAYRAESLAVNTRRGSREYGSEEKTMTGIRK